MLSNSGSATETGKKSLEDDFFCQANDFCVVKCEMNETDAIKHYVGQILEVSVKKFRISFLRKTIGVNRFSFPYVAYPTLNGRRKKTLLQK